MPKPVPIWQIATYITAAVVLVAVLILGGASGCKAWTRYQKRADARNQVSVYNIQIRQQAQRVKIAQQNAQIRYQKSVGIREAQDEIRKTLTPLYVQFEMVEALKEIATSGRNNTVVYLPTSPTSGLPVVPTSNTVNASDSKGK